jgi:hypothetical protein
MHEYFTEPEPNVIESSTGFSVTVLGRTGMRYSEGERSVWIDSEVLATPGAIAMFKETIRAWEGPDHAEVSATERDRIAGNIKRAFDACGYDLQVQEPFDWGSVALRPPHQPGELLISGYLTPVAAPESVLAIGRQLARLSGVGRQQPFQPVELPPHC